MGLLERFFRSTTAVWDPLKEMHRDRHKNLKRERGDCLKTLGHALAINLGTAHRKNGNWWICNEFYNTKSSNILREKRNANGNAAGFDSFRLLSMLNTPWLIEPRRRQDLCHHKYVFLPVNSIDVFAFRVFSMFLAHIPTSIQMQANQFSHQKNGHEKLKILTCLWAVSPLTLS